MFFKMASCNSKSFISSISLILTFYVILMSYGASAWNSNSQNSGALSQSSSRRMDNSRFKGLDKVLNRLDGGALSATTTTSTAKPEQSFPSLDSIFKSSKGQDVPVIPQFLLPTDPKEFDSLDDEDDLDDEDSYEDEEDDTSGNNDVLADKMTQWGYRYRDRYLASKTTPSTTTTTTTTTTTPAPPPPMSYSQFKWQNYGTRQGVEQSRRNSLVSNGGPSSYNNPSYHGGSHGSHHQNVRHHAHHNPTSQNHHNSHNQQQQHGNYRAQAQPQTPETAVREAVNHAIKVLKEGACKIPRPRVVRVLDFYPHPGKTYVPHCTILHQCSDDTGCCRHDVLTCSPKTTQRVELSFSTITVDRNRGSNSKYIVERLVFYNHTECECRDKMDEMMPRDVSYPDSSSFSKTGSLASFPKNSIDSETSSSSAQYQSLLGNPYEHAKNKDLPKCKCPSTFTERVLSDGSCSCDCFDKQQDCLRQKRGRDFFSMQDKWCIQAGRCEVPGCTYGSYIHLAGRCPRKKERLGQSLSWHRYLTQ